MNLKSMTSPTINLRTKVYGALCGAVAGQSVAILIILRNPVFFDHLWWTLLLLGPVPAGLGLLSGQVYSLVAHRIRRQEWIPSPAEKRTLALLVLGLLSSAVTIRHVSHTAADTPLGHLSPELLIVGLDGATWDIIDPMMEAGDLPTFVKLCKTGARGTLETLSPIRSPLIWTSVATGRAPEDHGITGYYGTRNDLKSARLWDVAHDHGKRVGLFRWLVTWPPDKQFEFTVPSWLARTPETWPPKYQFIQELDLNQDETGGSPSLSCILRGGVLHGFRITTTVDLISSWVREPSKTEEAFIERHMRCVEPSVDVFLYLLRKYQPDVTCLCLYGTDQLGHRFWKYFDPEPFGDVEVDQQEHYGEVIPEYYRLADRALGRILAVLPSTTVIVVSDHGMGPDLASPARYVFRMDRILHEAGLTGRFTVTFVQRRYILHPVAHLTPEELKSTRETLERIHLCESAEPIFRVELEEDGTIILNPMMGMVVDPEAPLHTTRGVIVNDNILSPDEAVEVRHLSGSHRSNGIIILKGSAIRPGADTRDATVLDIAPTALALLGLPVSREMPGRILEEVLQENFLAQHPVEIVDSFPPPPPIERHRASDAAVTERLRALGYVD